MSDRVLRAAPCRADRARHVRVENLRSESTHTVDMRDRVYDCADYQYRMSQIDGGRSKLFECLARIDEGVLCSNCGYRICRPSCPERGKQ